MSIWGAPGDAAVFGTSGSAAEDDASISSSETNSSAMTDWAPKKPLKTHMKT
jgi:hypothetical protein